MRNSTAAYADDTGNDYVFPCWKRSNIHSHSWNSNLRIAYCFNSQKLDGIIMKEKNDRSNPVIGFILLGIWICFSGYGAVIILIIGCIICLWLVISTIKNWIG